MRPISEEPVELGTIVARREYRVGRDRVVAELGTPHRASWKRDWYCAISVTYKRKKTINRAFGVDALQALMLAIQLLKVQLEGVSPRIRWDAGEAPGDVGIEKSLYGGLGFEFRKKIERKVDAAVLAEARRLERLHHRANKPGGRRGRGGARR